MNIYCYKYTTTLELLGVVDDFVSFSFQRSYSGIGEFQLVLDGQSLNASRVKEANVIRVSAGVSGYISKVSETHTDGEYRIILTGVELKGLVGKRIVYPPADNAYLTFNASPEYIIAQLIQTQLIAPVDTKRTLPLMSIAAFDESSTKIRKEYRFSDIQEEIVELAETYTIGWYADIENGSIIWHITHGTNRTETQDTNSRLVLSYENNYLQESSIELSNGVPTSALVAGQGEGLERELAYIGDTHQGIFRTEVYIDARDIKQGEDLTQRGYQKLTEYGSSSVYNATFSQSLLSRYRNDFDLGDVATIIDNRLPDGKMDIILTEIEEVYEDYPSLNATFGYDKATLAEVLKRQTANAETLVYTEQESTTAVAAIVQQYLLAAHPVGDIIYTKNAANPSTYIGGTWERIKGRFLWAMNDNDEVGATGGAATHTHTVAGHTHSIAGHTHTTSGHVLTSDEMPSHTHGLSLIGVNTAAGSVTDYGKYPVQIAQDMKANWRVSTLSMYATGGNKSHSHGKTDSTSLTTKANTQQTTDGGNNMPPYMNVYCWVRTA